MVYKQKHKNQYYVIFIVKNKNIYKTYFNFMCCHKNKKIIYFVWHFIKLTQLLAKQTNNYL